MTANRLQQALAECIASMGPERVCLDATELTHANAATFATQAVSPAILKPADREQVAACLQIANRYRIPVYPVSTGRNWGYGSRVAPQTGCMLLSLAALQDILEFDAMTGRIRLEPGVTFHQLHAYLRAQGASFQPPHTGSGQHTSVIGNIMERGIGKGLYEDMAAHVYACEGILANGQRIRTNADDAGPALFGLLPQCNLAVVVEVTLQLQPAPLFSQILTFPLAAGASMLLPSLRHLQNVNQRGAPRLQLAFLNDYRVATQISQFPHASHDPHVALPRHWLQESMATWGGAQWIGACTLWADDVDELAWRRHALNTALTALGIVARIELPQDNATLALDDDGLRCAYWRKTFAMPSQPDLDRDRCGVIWIAPVTSLSSPALETLVANMESTTLAHGLEPALTLRCSPTGSIRLVLGLFFDRDLPGADQRALNCQAELQALLRQAQVKHYRHTLLDGVPDLDTGVRSVLTVLKTHFDPHGILAPRRYCAP